LVDARDTYVSYEEREVINQRKAETNDVANLDKWEPAKEVAAPEPIDPKAKKK